MGFNWLLSHCLWCVSRYAISDCWLPEDNDVIAGLVSILFTWVLGDDRFHLLRCIKRPKGKAYVWNLSVNKKRPFEISSDDLINEACSKLTRNRHCISQSHLKSLHFRAGANGPAGQVLAWPLFTRRTPSFS